MIRYVGKAINAQDRLKRHLRDLKGKEHCKNWIRYVLSQGRFIEQTIIAFAATNEEACRLECYYIALFRSLGFDLTNATDGGEGVIGYKYSDEQKIEIGRLSKEAWERGAHTPESIEKTAAALRGKKKSPVVGKRISAGRKGKGTGRILTDAHKAVLLETSKKPKPYMAVVNKMPWSDERRANQSASQLRRRSHDKLLTDTEKLQKRIDRRERELTKLRAQLDNDQEQTG